MIQGMERCLISRQRPEYMYSGLNQDIVNEGSRPLWWANIKTQYRSKKVSIGLYEPSVTTLCCLDSRVNIVLYCSSSVPWLARTTKDPEISSRNALSRDYFVLGFRLASMRHEATLTF